MPSAEENKAIARRFLEETAKESFDVVDELVAPDFVDLSLQPGQEPEREGFKRSLAGLIAPFSKVNIIIAIRYFVGEDWEQEDDITLLRLRRSSALSRAAGCSWIA